jgi:hypothetical protein
MRAREHTLGVAPAQAGAHTADSLKMGSAGRRPSQRRTPGLMGPGLRRGDVGMELGPFLEPQRKSLGQQGIKRPPHLMNSASTFPSPASSMVTRSPGVSHSVFTRLPVSTSWPLCRPVPMEAR